MNSDGFRKAGYEMIEFSAVYMETLDKRDPLPHVTPGYLAKILPAEAPQKGESWEAIVKDFEAVALEGMAHWQHRQFFSYFPAGNSWASIMGDIFSNGCAANGTTWESCPVVTELEIIVLDWACKFLGLPSFFLSHFSNAESQGGGSIQTSASDAIMLSMIAARDDATLKMRKKFPDKPRAVLLNQMVAYCSSQCHSSVEKGGMVGTMRLRQLPADEQGGVRGETLRNAIKDDIADGLVPYFYCAILGSTGICAFDDLMEVGPVCKEFDMWMHVDAAYAGSCFSCPEMRYLMQGYQYAWSTNTNTNKWMLCNFDASLHWVRYRDKLVGCLTGYNPDLWNSGASPEFPIVNLKHFALPSTRRFRAFKLWCVMRNYGVTGLQRYCRNHIYLAKLFERYVQRDDRFEVVGPVRVGMTCFRLRSTNDINKQLLDALNLSRKIHMVPSAFHDKYVIRFALCAEDANEQDIDTAWRIIEEFASATIRVYEMEQKGSAALTQLFEKQHHHDDLNREHPDAERDKIEKEAMDQISKHVDESIVSQADFVAVDGSWSIGNEKSIKEYDEYVNQHPEIFVDHEVRGEVKLEKVPSMLRAHNLDVIEANKK